MSERGVALLAAMIGALGAIAAAIITVLLPEACHRGGGEATAVSRPPARATSADRRAATMPGLLAEFWNVPPFDREPQPQRGAPTSTRVDTRLAFRWQDDAPAPDVASDYFVARWSGEVHAPVSGTYQFLLAFDDGLRLTVNGTTALESWRRGGGRGRRADVFLEGDRWYPIVVDLFERDRWAELEVSWRRPGAKVEVLGGEFVRTAAR